MDAADASAMGRFFAYLQAEHEASTAEEIAGLVEQAEAMKRHTDPETRKLGTRALQRAQLKALTPHAPSSAYRQVASNMGVATSTAGVSLPIDKPVTADDDSKTEAEGVPSVCVCLPARHRLSVSGLDMSFARGLTRVQCVRHSMPALPTESSILCDCRPSQVSAGYEDAYMRALVAQDPPRYTDFLSAVAHFQRLPYNVRAHPPKSSPPAQPPSSLLARVCLLCLCFCLCSCSVPW